MGPGGQREAAQLPEAAREGGTERKEGAERGAAMMSVLYSTLLCRLVGPPTPDREKVTMMGHLGPKSPTCASHGHTYMYKWALSLLSPRPRSEDGVSIGASAGYV